MSNIFFVLPAVVMRETQRQQLSLGDAFAISVFDSQLTRTESNFVQCTLYGADLKRKESIERIITARVFCVEVARLAERMPLHVHLLTLIIIIMFASTHVLNHLPKCHSALLASSKYILLTQ